MAVDYTSSMATVERPITAADLLSLPELSEDAIGRCELVAGRVDRMTPAGFRHGLVTGAIAGALVRCLGEESRWRIIGGEAGFLLGRDPDTVRAADLAVVSRESAARAAARGGFFEGAPDLVVEVMSPSDAAAKVAEKTASWLAAGATAVWVVDPETQTVDVHEATQPESRRLGVRDVARLDCLGIARGVAVRELFPTE